MPTAFVTIRFSFDSNWRTYDLTWWKMFLVVLLSLCAMDIELSLINIFHIFEVFDLCVELMSWNSKQIDKLVEIRTERNYMCDFIEWDSYYLVSNETIKSSMQNKLERKIKKEIQHNFTKMFIKHTIFVRFSFVWM